MVETSTSPLSALLSFGQVWVPLHILTVPTFLDSSASPSPTVGAEPQRAPPPSVMSIAAAQHPSFPQGQSGVSSGQLREASVGYTRVTRPKRLHLAISNAGTLRPGFPPIPAQSGQLIKVNSLIHTAKLTPEFLQLNGPEC